MSSAIRVLLKNVLVPDNEGFKKIYIYIDNDRIADLGEEIPVEYEFAELVLDYNGEYLAFPGFSALVSLTERYRDIAMYGSIDKKELVRAALYELIMNGVTLPIIVDDEDSIVRNVLKELEFPAVLIEKEADMDQKDVYIKGKLGDDGISINNVLFRWNEICGPNKLNDSCKLLDLRGLHTYNVSALLSRNNIEPEDAGFINVLWRPYKALGIGDCRIVKDMRADIVLYRITIPPKLVTHKNYRDLLRSGYPPDTVIIAGELFIDKNEPLILQPPRITPW